MKKLLAFFLCAVMILMIPATCVYALPSDDNAAEEGSDDIAFDIAGALIAWSIDAVKTGSSTKIGNYAADTLFDMILGEKSTDQQIINQLDKVKDSLQQLTYQTQILQNQMKENALWENIATFLVWKDGVVTPLETYYKALRHVDHYLATGTKDGKPYSPENAAQTRKKILIEDLGNAQNITLLSDFDNSTMKMAMYLLDPKQYVSGISGNLFDIHREAMRYKYHWEHQAMNEMKTFQESVLTTFMVMATLDRLSLNARIEQAEDEGKETDVLITRRDELNKKIEGVAKLTQSLVKKRAADERYYWTPGHEMLLKVGVQKTLPQENTKKGLYTAGEEKPTNNSIQGVVYSWKPYSQGKRIKEFRVYSPFWEPFVTYSKTVQTISYDQLKTIYEDYGGQKTLYEIFFSEQEGAMPAIPGANASWTFLVNTDKDHPIGYQPHFWKADRVLMYGVNTSTATTRFPEASQLVLAFYHNTHTDLSNNRNRYISIGYVGSSDEETDICTVIDNNANQEQLRWTASDGNLNAPFGGIDHVKDYTLTIGNVQVPGASMKLTETADGVTVCVDAAFLRQLPLGEHQVEGAFICETEEGVLDPVMIAYRLKILPPSIIRGDQTTVVQGEKETLSFTSDALFGDFIRVELDGNTLDTQYYTKKEGSTVITLKAEFVEDLSAGDHTLAIVSQNGTATARFTVKAKTVDVQPTTPGSSVEQNMKNQLWIWGVCLAVVIGGVIGMILHRKKK